MNSTPIKLAGIAALFVLVFLFGFWLNRSGKPYPGLVFNLHKLIALVAGVVLLLALLQINRAAPFSPVHWLALGLAGLSFAAAAVSGGLLSIARPMPLIVLRLHQAGPFAALICTGVLLFLLLRR